MTEYVGAHRLPGNIPGRHESAEVPILASPRGIAEEIMFYGITSVVGVLATTAATRFVTGDRATGVGLGLFALKIGVDAGMFYRYQKRH
jgi:hypothetical protein